MKKIFSILFTLLILISSPIFSQSKLKGNKIVTIQNREVTNFNKIEVSANVDVYLFQGERHFVSVETDENLQNSVKIQVENQTLRINFTDKITKTKKMNVFVTVTDSLQLITAYKNSNVYADNRLILRKLTINAFENSDFNIKVDADDFNINGFKKTALKVDVFSKNLNVSISESSKLKLEGEIDTLTTEVKNNSVITVKGKGLKLAIDAKNNGTFNGANFKVDNATIIANANSNLTVNVVENIKIAAEKNASISIYQEPVIEIEKLEGKAKIFKKKPFKLF